MSTQRDTPAEGYPTRREIREAERRAEAAARLTAQASQDQLNPPMTTRAATPAPDPAESDSSEFDIPPVRFTPVTGFSAVVDQPDSAALLEGAGAGDAPLTPAVPFTSVTQWARDTGELAAVKPQSGRSSRRTVAAPASVAIPPRAESLVETAGHRISFAQGIPTPAHGGPVANMAEGMTETEVLSSRTVARTWMPRVALLGTLAAATSIIPITGAPAAPQSAPAGISYSTSDQLDILMDATPESPSADVSALGADPNAAVRAVVTASRSTERQSCTSAMSSANGVDAAALASAPVDLVMPLTSGSYRITSRYGYRSLWGRYSQHAGVDMAAPVGTPIHAIADGVVEYAGAGKSGRSSMLIIVRHNVNGKIVRSWYVHMYSNGVYASAGQQVKAGDVIGAVGNNGNSTGPHLHLEIHLDDNLTTTDPLTWLKDNGATTLTRDVLECIAN